MGSSLSRDWTCNPCVGTHRVVTSGSPGKSLGYLLLYTRYECIASELNVLLWQLEEVPVLWFFHQHQMHPAYSSKWGGDLVLQVLPVSIFKKARTGRNSTAPVAPPQGLDPASQALCILFQLENEAISSISTFSAWLHFSFLSWLKLYGSYKIPTEFFSDSYLFSAEHFSKKCWIKIQGGRRYKHTF